MPPVSVTMQPRSLPADGVGESDLDGGGVDEGELALVADVQAVANKAMAPNATTFLIAVRTVKPPAGVARRWLRAARAAWGHTEHRARVYELNSRVTIRESRRLPR
jgi:hypothetical protein